MRRVRARSLVLVNWRGVFYERYVLDDNVTALEGDNGAGKTTVMIAAYVVLLPDMIRLRFTNVGEGDSIGGDRGIWGRLGNPDRPSYAVLSFDVGGEHVVVGVHLERKGEPSVELTPFIIADLPADVRLQDALLLRAGDEDRVPELGELRENVARFGGRLHIFRTAKEYFAALFERGITPLRLVTDEERTRFNDMLRTSMTGGISRALTSEFRSFLLKEESGLADTLMRMRSNLDACRRTRTEVREAQALEREISGVYEAGHAMFAAALLATRERAEELRRRMDEAQQRHQGALRERDAVAHDFEGRTQERVAVEERLSQARARHDEARAKRERVAAANAIATRIAGIEEELRGVRRELATAAADLERAEQRRGLREAERRRAEDTYLQAAKGLADLQQGLDLFHRRADAYRAATRRLAEARTALDRPELAGAEVDGARESTRAIIADIDRKRSELDATIAGAEAHAAAHAETTEALALVIQRDVAKVDALREAIAALAKLAELDNLAARAEAMEEEFGRVRSSLRRQQAVRLRAQEVIRPGEPLASSADVQTAFRNADAELRAAEKREREETERHADEQRTHEELKARKEALEARRMRWRELDTVAARLEATLGAGLRSAGELEAARQLLDDERDGLQRRREALASDCHHVLEHARSLEEAGGVFHEDLLTARDIVGGELLASHFDEVDPEDAGRVQARLGPLAEAIVVDDAREAASVLVGRERALDTIWLVEEGGLRDVLAPDGSGEFDIGPGDVAIAQGGVVRTTRVPSAPTLGRKARERRIAELRAQEVALGSQIEALDGRLAEVDARRRDTALLARDVATLTLGDPSGELEQVAIGLRETEARMGAHGEAAAKAGREATLHAERSAALRELLAEAFLLDEPDLAGRAEELEAAWRSAVRARSELGRVAQARKILAEGMEALRRTPLSGARINAARREFEELGEQRARLFLGADALDYVTAHREALDWTDAEAALAQKQELVPAVQRQCEQADAARQAAADAESEAEQARDQTRATWRAIDDRRSALEERRRQAHEDLAASGVDDPSDAAVERARAEADGLGGLVEELQQTERRLAEAVATLGERLSAREEKLREATDQLAAVEREWKPAADLWERLRARAENNGLLTPAITARLLETAEGSSVQLRTEARTRAAHLEERLRAARGGDEILERIRAWLSGQEQTTGDDFLQAWEVVRDWLRRRVPAQVAEVDDPLEALEQLRRHLEVLGARLEDQERKLRGASEDVARGIDVHIRNAQRQVRLLNGELDGVQFGTIRNMRIRLSRDERMEGVLRALREGTAQELLFAPTMPIEDALEELFVRHGGRGRTMGQRLLDYREYLEVGVEIQRQASVEWECVNPSRISTGEAIGIGSALMMVVLTAWERAANLFRAKRSLGTLRLLFLDEANRLSQDNLEVLFELCTTLSLQLLIASPEVARGPGCTTYRLVRHETQDGKEEVIVTGRKTVAEA